MRIVALVAAGFMLSAPLFGQVQSAGTKPSSPAIGPTPSDYFVPLPVAAYADVEKMLQEPTPIMTLQPEDMLHVTLYGVKDFDVTIRVGSDGTLRLPLVGAISVKDMTTAQVEETIEHDLSSRNLVLEPSVTVAATEQPAQRVVVSGEVVKPGVFASFGKHSLNEYIAMAGGLQGTASLVVTIVRPTLASPIMVALGPDNQSLAGNLPIYPGDEVKVARVGMYYVLGAVGHQGAFPLNGSTPVTIEEALAVAGGLSFNAKRTDAQIVRVGQNGNRVLISIPITKILKGKIGDITLKNDDILYLPPSNFKSALKGTGVAPVISIATALLYAGVI
jgi:polysaccharide export outer membrane protein